MILKNNKIVKNKKIIIFEDNCESLGAELKRKKNRNIWSA